MNASRLKSTAITLAVLALLFALAGLSARYSSQIDLSKNAANTLSAASQKLLQSMPGPVQVTAYIQAGKPIRQQIAQLADRYRRYKPDMTLSFTDPNAEPDKIRELGIGKEGIITVSYEGRLEKISFLDESTLSNALLQLSHSETRWATFLSGHGERSPQGNANFDFSSFSKELALRNIKALPINLATIPDIPDNTSVLVIASPAVPLLPGELAIVKAYIGRGGNLLLLTDPSGTAMTEVLALVGIQQLPGTLVDNSYSLYGVADPTFIIASEYLEHPITQDFKTITIYPKTAALDFDSSQPYQGKALFTSTAKSWAEAGPLAGKLAFDGQSGDWQGPLPFCYALTRDLGAKKQQRIVVVGDGDFIANAYLGNVGNRDMGLRMFNWLAHNDQFIDIPAKPAGDKTLQLSQHGISAMAFGYMVILPVMFLASGLAVWFVRKRR